MEHLTLNDKQKEQLLELCKEFFTEFSNKEIRITSSFPYYNCSSQEGVMLGMPDLKVC